MRVCVVLLLVVPLLALSSCDDDCPTCPSAPTEMVSDYDIVLSGFGGQSLSVYNTKEMAIVDSLQFGDLDRMANIALSPDGRHLMVALWLDAGPETRIFDIETGDLVKTLPFGLSIEVSNDGRYIAMNNFDRLFFLDGTTYELLFSDTIVNRYTGRFLIDGTKFYCVKDDYYIHIYDMASQTIDTVFRYYDTTGFSPEIHHIQPDPTGQKIYFSCLYSPYDFFLKGYSIVDDSTIFEYRVARPAFSDLRLTPDGSQIIYTDPGDVIFDEFGSMYVIFIEPETGAIISIVDANYSTHGQMQYGVMPGLFDITPDSRYTIVACAAGCPAYGVIDNVQHRFVDMYYDTSIPQVTSFMYVTCSRLLH